MSTIGQAEPLKPQDAEGKQPDYMLPSETIACVEAKQKDGCGGLFIVGITGHIGVVKAGYGDPFPGMLESGGWAWRLVD